MSERTLEAEVARLQRAVSHLVDRCTSLEQEVGTLSNLYIASQRLHEPTDRSEVLRAMEEILINLVGSEELAIFEVDAHDTSLHLLSSFGLDSAHWAHRSLDDGPLSLAVRSGKTVVPGPDFPQHPDEPRMTACVPLRLRERVIGVIAVFRLLPQKRRLEAVDHDLFDLLATAGGPALHLATAAAVGAGERS